MVDSMIKNSEDLDYLELHLELTSSLINESINLFKNDLLDEEEKLLISDLLNTRMSLLRVINKFNQKKVRT